MTIYEAPDGPDFFTTEQGLEAMRSVGTIALDCDPENLQGMLDFVENETGRTLGGPLGQTSFVLMRGAANPLKSDRHYFESPLELPLVPSSEFGANEPDFAAKQDLVEARRHIFEVRPGLWRGGVAPYIARMVMGPRPEDQALTAGLSAWGRQIRDAFTLTDPKKNRIQEEVAQRFPSAVVLRRSIEPRTS